MEWISKDSFQISKNTPVRQLRGLTRAENRSFFLMVQNAIGKRRSEVQKIADKRIADLEKDVKSGLLDEENFKELRKQISIGVGATVRMLGNYIEMGIGPANIERACNHLTPEAGQDLEFASIRIIISDFKKEEEYDQLTEGNSQDILNTIRKLSSMTKEERESFFSSSDSPALSTGNGAVPNAGSTGSTPKETVTVK